MSLSSNIIDPLFAEISLENTEEKNKRIEEIENSLKATYGDKIPSLYENVADNPLFMEKQDPFKIIPHIMMNFDMGVGKRHLENYLKHCCINMPTENLYLLLKASKSNLIRISDAENRKTARGIIENIANVIQQLEKTQRNQTLTSAINSASFSAEKEDPTQKIYNILMKFNTKEHNNQEPMAGALLYSYLFKYSKTLTQDLFYGLLNKAKETLVCIKDDARRTTAEQIIQGFENKVKEMDHITASTQTTSKADKFEQDIDNLFQLTNEKSISENGKSASVVIKGNCLKILKAIETDNSEFSKKENLESTLLIIKKIQDKANEKFQASARTDDKMSHNAILCACLSANNHITKLIKASEKQNLNRSTSSPDISRKTNNYRDAVEQRQTIPENARNSYLEPVVQGSTPKLSKIKSPSNFT